MNGPSEEIYSSITYMVQMRTFCFFNIKYFNGGNLASLMEQQPQEYSPPIYSSTELLGVLLPWCHWLAESLRIRMSRSDFNVGNSQRSRRCSFSWEFQQAPKN